MYRSTHHAFRTRYYRTVRLSYVSHTVEMCSSTIWIFHLRERCTEAPNMVSGCWPYMHCLWHGFSANILLPVLLSKKSVPRYYHTAGTLEPALHKAHSWFLEVPPTCTFIGMASLLLYDFQYCAAGTPCAILPNRGAIQCLTHGRTV